MDKCHDFWSVWKQIARELEHFPTSIHEQMLWPSLTSLSFAFIPNPPLLYSIHPPSFWHTCFTTHTCLDQKLGQGVEKKQWNRKTLMVINLEVCVTLFKAPFVASFKSKASWNWHGWPLSRGLAPLSRPLLCVLIATPTLWPFQTWKRPWGATTCRWATPTRVRVGVTRAFEIKSLCPWLGTVTVSTPWTIALSQPTLKSRSTLRSFFLFFQCSISQSVRCELENWSLWHLPRVYPRQDAFFNHWLWHRGRTSGQHSGRRSWQIGQGRKYSRQSGKGSKKVDSSSIFKWVECRWWTTWKMIPSLTPPWIGPFLTSSPDPGPMTGMSRMSWTFLSKSADPSPSLKQFVSPTKLTSPTCRWHWYRSKSPTHSHCWNRSRKFFVDPFVDSVKQLAEATNKDMKERIEVFKTFVNTYGTHYASTTEMGTKITIERRYTEVEWAE